MYLQTRMSEFGSDVTLASPQKSRKQNSFWLLARWSHSGITNNKTHSWIKPARCCARDVFNESESLQFSFRLDSAHRPTSSSQTFATVKSCTVSLNTTDSSHVPFLLNIQRRERSAQVKLSCLRGRLRRGERHFLSYFPDSKTWQTIEEAGLQASCSGRCLSINTAEAGTL